MLISNRSNSRNAKLNGFSTSLLIGEVNSNCKDVSIQITDVDLNGEQFIHCHKQAQCYFIISGNGLMTIDDEAAYVEEGDAIYVPSNSQHGIKNVGSIKLTYLTANQAFGIEKEQQLWSNKNAL